VAIARIPSSATRRPIAWSSTALALFVQVAEKGSLSGAADALGLSNPAATRYLASLENRLQVRLVERNTRRLYLTSEGQEFVERARHVLAELQDAEAALHSSALSPSGLLRVSASLSFSMQVIAPRLPKYHQRYPQVRVHIETANRYLDIIDNGIDVAIRTREYEPDSTITIRRLAATRCILAASPAYLAGRGRPLSPAELHNHDLLVYVHANNPNELKFVRGSDQQIVTAQGLLESNDGQVLRAAALNGLGILIQPSYILYDDLVAGRLVPVLEDWDLPRLQINIAYPSRKHLSAKVRSFIDFMVAECAENEYEKKWTSRM
jgi:DNA-binding transcriptional LysR family regulator